jgi:hypothetical protein
MSKCMSSRSLPIGVVYSDLDVCKLKYKPVAEAAGIDCNSSSSSSGNSTSSMMIINQSSHVSHTSMPMPMQALSTQIQASPQLSSLPSSLAPHFPVPSPAHTGVPMSNPSNHSNFPAAAAPHGFALPPHPTK